MAKLTLTFKGKPIRSFQFEGGERVRIGRNHDNEIQIDSLAVAPVHAEIKFGSSRSVISQKQLDFPLLVNNAQTSRHELQHGDQIAIGKHVLYFTEDSTLLEAPSPLGSWSPEDNDLKLLNEELRHFTQSSDAQLQILNGRNIGRMVSLKAGLTRLGKSETGVAVIAKRKDGFFVAALDGKSQIRLNGQPVLDKSIKLNHGDLLEIDRTEMQFFANEMSPEPEHG
ncbi:MAG: FHA domain-containing protein [Gammaproteobacteria bacterium]